MRYSRKAAPIAPSIGWLMAGLALIVAASGAPAAQGAADSAREQVGEVVVALGDVSAVGAEGTTRTLERADPIFAGDTVRTGPSARVTIRFIDEGRVALRPESEFAIDAYDYDAEHSERNRVRMRVERGGFLTQSGQVGKQDREAYRLQSPFAVVGIRGTVYGGVIVEEDGELVEYFGVYTSPLDGNQNDANKPNGIEISNNVDSIKLGSGQPFNFGRLTGPDEPIEGVPQLPEQLNGSFGLSGQLTGGGADGDDDATSASEDAGVGTENVGPDDARAANKRLQDGEIVSQIDSDDEPGKRLFTRDQRCL